MQFDCRRSTCWQVARVLTTHGVVPQNGRLLLRRYVRQTDDKVIRTIGCNDAQQQRIGFPYPNSGRIMAYIVGTVKQILRAYDVEGAYERWMQDILNNVSQSITNVLCIVRTKSLIFVLKHQFYVMT